MEKEDASTIVKFCDPCTGKIYLGNLKPIAGKDFFVLRREEDV
jgi:hypothetical protein